MSDHNQFSLKKTMDILMDSYSTNAALAEVRIMEQYSKIVGKTITKYTNDMKFNDGVLKIYIETAPLKHELEYMKENLKTRLNKAFGKEFIKEIEIRKY